MLKPAFVYLALAALLAGSWAPPTNSFVADGAAFLVLRKQADAAYTVKNWPAAASLYAEIAKADSPDGGAWFRLGRARSHLGDYNEAIGDFREALRLGFVDAPRGQYAIAQTYALAGNADAALLWLRQALAAGYRDRVDIASDDAFKGIANDPRFRQLTSTTLVAQTRSQGWIADLDYLVAEIKRAHYLYRSALLPPEFVAQERRFRQTVSSMSDAQALLHLQKLVAMLGDGHSLIYPAGMKRGTLHVLPLHLYWFREGLFVLSDKDDPSLAQCRVLKIGGLDPGAVVERVLPYMSHDNDSEIEWVSPGYLIISELLDMVGVGSKDSAKFTIECRGKPVRDVLIRAVARPPTEEDYDITLPPLRTIPQPLSLSNTGKPYWFVELPQGIVYLQFNHVRNDESEPLTVFAARMRRTLAGPGIRGLVIDLRRNNGGEATLTPDLLRTLVWFDIEKGTGSIVALVGRNTFSAAQDFANYLQIMTDAIFVGEPTGSRPILVGDTSTFQLPYSGAIGQLAPGLHADALYRDDRVWISADVPATLTAEDYFSGKDTALNSAIAILARSNRG